MIEGRENKVLGVSLSAALSLYSIYQVNDH